MVFTAVLSYRVHFKVDQLSSSEGDDHLPLVHGAADDCLFAGSLPLVHTLVGSDVADTVWVYLRGEAEGRGKAAGRWGE